ncbi:hypothetical protein ACWEN6_39920 [Sphaerisporangium sp. NPDC004334]
MPDENLSQPQLAALFALMRAGGEISNPELKEHYGLTLDGKDRTKLNRLRLVESRKLGRAYAHTLTDSGWARLGEEMRSGVWAWPGSQGVMLRVLQGGLRDFMAHNDLRLADVFATPATPEPTAPSDPEPSIPPGPEQAAAPSSPSGGDPEARVRAAYAGLADQPGTWVGLAKLRALLADLPRGEVDATLLRMEELPDVTLVPETDRKRLSQEDRDAAVRIAGQDKHLLWIGA